MHEKARDQIIQMTEFPYDLILKMFCEDNIDRVVEYYRTGSTFPFAMEISPTNRCNLDCSWCISKYYHRNDELDIGKLKEFLKDYKRMGGKSVGWSGGGEPTMYRHIVEAIEYADKIRLEQGMMSNGVFSEELIDLIGNKMVWLRISLDTANRSLYKRLKGADVLPVVEKNVRALSHYPVKVGINVNMNRENERDVVATARKAKKWGANVFQLRPVMPVINPLTGGYDDSPYISGDLKGITESLMKLEDRSIPFGISMSHDKFSNLTKGRIYDSCISHNFFFVLNANGDLCVCMYHLYEDDFTFGNINEGTLEEIWNSEKRRKVILSTRNMDFSKCQVCCKGHGCNEIMYKEGVIGRMSDRRFL